MFSPQCEHKRWAPVCLTTALLQTSFGRLTLWRLASLQWAWAQTTPKWLRSASSKTPRRTKLSELCYPSPSIYRIVNLQKFLTDMWWHNIPSHDAMEQRHDCCKVSTCYTKSVGATPIGYNCLPDHTFRNKNVCKNGWIFSTRLIVSCTTDLAEATRKYLQIVAPRPDSMGSLCGFLLRRACFFFWGGN